MSTDLILFICPQIGVQIGAGIKCPLPSQFMGYLTPKRPGVEKKQWSCHCYPFAGKDSFLWKGALERGHYLTILEIDRCSQRAV